jgi:translation initiation factor 2B subunit (eIF-2B alpha/beta/delta family)
MTAGRWWVVVDRAVVGGTVVGGNVDVTAVLGGEVTELAEAAAAAAAPVVVMLEVTKLKEPMATKTTNSPVRRAAMVNHG